MTRDQALEKLQTNPWKEEILQQELDYVAKKLNISVDQLQQYIDNPPKYFWNYPNADTMLEFGYRIYRWLMHK